ncbi:MAG: ABC transporter ATP-binding protein [Clostridiales bacterium]|nr:ABC transporter ATP-binding protein [Clostridiales bacterium]
MTSFLECHHIEKKYKDFSLKSISFTLESGYLTGLVGRNGAGKTTLLNILSGLDSRFEGQVLIDGVDLSHNPVEAKQQIALVSENISHFMEKTPLENAQLLGKYFSQWSMEQFYIWLDRLELDKGKALFQYSKGMYMKYQLAFAMSHGAKFLILDEPTAGFDPVFRRDFMKILQDVRDEDVGILMSTHILSDIQSMADYLLVLDEGKLQYDGAMENLNDPAVQKGIYGTLRKKLPLGELLKRNGGKKDDLL